MNKENNDAICESELNEWIFPHVQIEVKQEEPQQNVMTEEQKNAMMEEHLLPLKLELQAIKVEYEHKINLLNDIQVKLGNALAIFDNELIDLIQDIIKKSVKKIIYKEIKADAKLIVKIINELKSTISSQNGIINVNLSEVDYERLKDDNSTQGTVINADSLLQEGDVVIKSNFTEIRSILNNRIDKMLGLKNE